MSRKQAFMGQVPFSPPIASFPPVTCPPGKVPFNLAGRLVCVDPETFPASAEYGGMRPVGAFGGFGMAPSAPIGTAGMGPSNVPFTMGRRAMLGEVRLVGHPHHPRSRAL